jgi:hypothetical protein
LPPTRGTRSIARRPDEAQAKREIYQTYQAMKIPR